MFDNLAFFCDHLFVRLNLGGTFMSIAGHLDSLKQKHSLLEEKIADVSASPMPDQSRVTTLKREKLRLKEQIDKIETSVGSETKH